MVKLTESGTGSPGGSVVTSEDRLSIVCHALFANWLMVTACVIRPGNVVSRHAVHAFTRSGQVGMYCVIVGGSCMLSTSPLRKSIAYQSSYRTE